jgi:hypothetical protein
MSQLLLYLLNAPCFLFRACASCYVLYETGRRILKRSAERLLISKWRIGDHMIDLIPLNG